MKEVGFLGLGFWGLGMKDVGLLGLGFEGWASRM